MTMKNLFKDVDTIIFDNDGTLFQADLVSFPAIISGYKDLMKIYQVKLTIPSKGDINAQIGLPVKEYFKSLLPDNLQNLSDEFYTICNQHEVNNIKKGLGSLYPDVKETLIELKKRNYKLGIVTNASLEYFNAIAETFEYHHLFDGYLCLGERPHQDKSDLLKELLDHFKTKKGAIVGDRENDLLAGKKYNCLTIAALYGYGSEDELKKADETIKSFSQLLNLFQ